MATEMREPTYWILTSLLGGPRHGYAIVKDIAALSLGRIEIKVTTLYGALERLEGTGMIAGAGDEVVDGRRRQYFRITDAGAAGLAAEAQRLSANANEAAARLQAAGWHPPGAIGASG